MCLMTISDQIRAAILNAGISRYELARRSGVSEAALSKFVNGRSITTALLDRLAHPLGLRLIVRKSSTRTEKGR
jgi:transcriptional regulator with XRE-family HTH domain